MRSYRLRQVFLLWFGLVYTTVPKGLQLCTYLLRCPMLLRFIHILRNVENYNLQKQHLIPASSNFIKLLFWYRQAFLSLKV